MKLFKGKKGHISWKSHRKSGKLYCGSQEVEKKKTPWHIALLMGSTENEKKGCNSAPDKKYKGTLLSLSFKVWENKVFFALYILPKGLRYRHFLKSRMAPCWCGQQKIRGWLYLSLWAKIEKSKDNLLSSNFKVRENKVPFVLFF